MTAIKSAIRVTTLREIGTIVEANLEAARMSLAEAEGVQKGIGLVLAAFEGNRKKIEKDLADQKVTQDQADIELKGLRNAENIVKSMLLGSARIDQLSVLAKGRIQALETIHKNFARVYEGEKTRLAELEAAEMGKFEDPNIYTRPIGTHPGDPLAKNRASDPTAEPPVETPVESKVETPQTQNLPFTPDAP